MSFLTSINQSVRVFHKTTCPFKHHFACSWLRTTALCQRGTGLIQQLWDGKGQPKALWRMSSRPNPTHCTWSRVWGSLQLPPTLSILACLIRVQIKIFLGTRSNLLSRSFHCFWHSDMLALFLTIMTPALSEGRKGEVNGEPWTITDRNKWL